MEKRLSADEMRREFFNSHGKFVRGEAGYYFEDGAFVACSGMMVGPPRDEDRRLTKIVQYHKAKYDLAVEEYRTIKSNIKKQVQAAQSSPVCTAPFEEGQVKEKLEGLMKKVAKCKKEYEKALSKVPGHRPEDIAEKERKAEIDYSNREKCQSLLEAIGKYEI